jgi:hypothetical protein
MNNALCIRFHAGSARGPTLSVHCQFSRLDAIQSPGRRAGVRGMKGLCRLPVAMRPSVPLVFESLGYRLGCGEGQGHSLSADSPMNSEPEARRSHHGSKAGLVLVCPNLSQRLSNLGAF